MIGGWRGKEKNDRGMEGEERKMDIGGKGTE